MKKYRILFFFLLLFNCIITNAQEKRETKAYDNLYRFMITNSFGYNTDHSKPVFYISINRYVKQNFYLGLKAGVLNYFTKAIDELKYALMPYYYNKPAGQYEINGLPFETTGLSYVLSLQPTYFLNKNISVNIGAGIRTYSNTAYSTFITFSKSSQNQPLVLYNLGYVDKNTASRNIIKAYYSVGIDYHIDRLILGVYGDNLFSFGINTGIKF